MRAVSHLPVDLSIAADVMTTRAVGHAATDVTTTRAQAQALATNAAPTAAAAMIVAHDPISQAGRAARAATGTVIHRLVAAPPDDYTRGERSARGQRPPMREYTDASMRSRGGPRGAGDSGARGRAGAAVAQTRGGVWGDEPLRPAGLRPGMAGARNGRGARRDEAADEEESTSAAAAFGKALLAIILALLIGAGAAYGYYMYSTPKAPASVTPPSTTPASGASGSTGGVSSGSAHMAPFSAQRDARTLFVAGADSWTW